MKNIFVVGIIEKDGKIAACSTSIGTGNCVLSWANGNGFNHVYFFPTKKECDDVANDWNQSFIEQGKYIYQSKEREEN